MTCIDIVEVLSPRILLNLRQPSSWSTTEKPEVSSTSLPHIAQLFEQWDSAGAGVIDRNDIIGVMLQFCTGVAQNELEGLLNTFDPCGSHTVKYVEFVQWLSKPFVEPALQMNSLTTNSATNAQRSRLLLMFERLPKLLGLPDKVSKKKLRKDFPHFTNVVEALMSGYLEHGGKYYRQIEKHLEQLLSGSEDERMKYTKYFTGTRNEFGTFESVSGILVTADDPPMLIAKRMAMEHEVEVPHGTVEMQDVVAGSRQYYLEAAALRETQEELGVTVDVDLRRVRAVVRKRARQAEVPHVDDEALTVLTNFVKTSLSKLPETPEEHASALLALNRIVGKDGQYPGLLSHASKWFDAKDWVGYLIPVPPWEEFRQRPCVARGLAANALVCQPLDGSSDFQINAGLRSGGTIDPDGWNGLDMSEHAKRFLQTLLQVA